MTPRYLLALTGVAALLVAGCASSNSTTTTGASVAGNAVDRAFVADMIPHHRAAVQMGKIARRRGSSAFVTQLASDIVRTQTAEIATMRARDSALAGVGVKRGSLGLPAHMTGMDADMGMLDTAKPFDAAFMRMMIPHHQAAVLMANAELERGRDPALTTLARNIISAQQREIREMRRQLDASAGDTMHGSGAMHGSTTSG